MRQELYCGAATVTTRNDDETDTKARKRVAAMRNACAPTLSVDGEKPLMVLDPKNAPGITGPACVDGIGPAADWQGYWKAAAEHRRKTKSWANGH